MDKPSIPKGTRDFGPAQMAKREFIFDTIKRVFQKFGFQPLETPAMENLTTLTGKYGDEGDQLLFKILNSGDFLQEIDASELANRNSKSVAARISEKGLRYDLTVPFARYVVMNRHEIAFPFKRYQIQPVWRADRPQKGRYREFYQCDADVVGTNSLLAEAEIILMIQEIFLVLGIPEYTIKVNHRGILIGLAEIIGAQGKESSLFTAMDKLDKIGEVKVREELLSKNIDGKSADALFSLLNRKGSNAEKIEFLKGRFAASSSGLKGLNDLQQIFQLISDFGGSHQSLEMDTSLARGLSYYTGTIFEVKINNVAIGSVSGGGRYDDLTGVFGMPGISGTGISFGVDRLYDAMEELKLFKSENQISSKVLVAAMDNDSWRYGLNIIHRLREKNIPAEIYPDPTKLKKQLEYADRKMIPYTIVIGSEEMESQILTFKNMTTGDQQKLSVDQILNHPF